MIEINGKYYEPKEREGPSKSSKSLLRIAALAAMMGPYGVGGANSYERKRPSVDIPSEYAKILEKKSDLSRADRDWVVYMFKEHYREVSQTEIQEREERIKKLKEIVLKNKPHE